ncbi:MAG: hypothetical protein ACLFQS_04145 [Bacteroidales bacterium]
MKKQKTLTVIALMSIGSMLFFTQCKSKQEVAATPGGETRVEVLCSGPEFFTDGEYFRANSVAESPNQANSKRMALSNARAELAGQLEVTVKSVIDNYVQDIAVGDQQEYQQRYEGLSREVINQTLNGTRVICEELTRTEQGRYKTYLAIELMGSEVLNAMNQRISKDDRLRLDYDYEKFKKNFNEEMEKLENQY